MRRNKHEQRAHGVKDKTVWYRNGYNVSGKGKATPSARKRRVVGTPADPRDHWPATWCGGCQEWVTSLWEWRVHSEHAKYPWQIPGTPEYEAIYLRGAADDMGDSGTSYDANGQQGWGSMR